MKIIQLIYSLISGGAEKFAVDLSNQLAAEGHDVTLCILRPDSDKELIFNKQFLSEKVKFHSLKLSPGFSPSKCQKVDKYIKSQHPDIVHCHLNVIPYIFKTSIFNKNIKFFHTLHNIAAKTGGVGIQYHLNKFFYRHNLIRPVCISRLCQQSYEEHYKLSNAPYIDNGRAIVGFSEKYKDVEKEIISYKKSPETKVFIHVARFNNQKNQHLLINSFNRLSAENVDYTLLVIGRDFDTPDGRKLQDIANNRIHFLGEKDNVNDYLLCSDAFCLSSIYEGLPISILEALSCGVTPICTPVGGIPDVIKDEKNGYLSTGIETDEYCTAIKRFIERAIDKDQLIDFYKINYSIDVCAKKYESLFNAALR